MAKKLGVNAQKLKDLDTFIGNQQRAAASSGTNMQKSISNYQTRLNAAGVNPTKATDKRNWFEKLTNLPEGQNALFDLFELIGRPQQALFGAIQEAQEGGDPLEGLKSGFTGEEHYSGGDILRNMGVSDKKLFTGPLSGEDRSLADILGFGADILADPVDLALFAATPVTGGASGAALAAKEGASGASKVAKAAKAVDTATDIAKAAKAVDTATDIAKAAKTADTAMDIAKVAKAADTAADTTKYVYKFNPLKAMINPRESKSLLEMATGGAAKGVKNLTGKAITKGAELSDIKTISKLAKSEGLIESGTKVTKEMLPELTTKLADAGIDVSTKSDALKSLKKSFSKTADYAGSFEDNLFNKVKRSDNAIDAANAYGKKYASDLKTNIGNYAKKAGKNADDVEKDILSYISSKYKPETGMDYYVKDAIKNKGKSSLIKGSKEDIDKIQKALSDFKIKNNVSDNALNIARKGEDGLAITGKSKLLKAVESDKGLMKQLSDIKYTKAQNLDKDVLKNVTRITGNYNSDKAFRKLVDDAEKGYGEFNKYLKQATGETVDFKDMLREGYVTNSLTDEGRKALDVLNEEKVGRTSKMQTARNTNEEMYKGSTKAFNEKRYANQTQQANKEFTQDIIKTRDRYAKDIESLRNRSYKSDVEKIKGKISAIEEKKLESANKFKEKISKANIKGERANELVKKYNAVNDNLSDIISDEVVKKASKVSDVNLSSSLLKKSEKYNNKVAKLEEAKKLLSKEGLTTKQYEKALENFEKASDAVLKAKNDVIYQAAKIEGAVDETFIKEAGKLANDMSKKSANAAKQSAKQTTIRDNARKLEEQFKQSYNSTLNNFNKQQSDLRLELNKLKNKTPEQIEAYNKAIADQITHKQKVVDVLNSVEGKKLYNEMFTESFDAFLNKTTNQAKAMKNYNEILLQSGLENTNVVKFFKTGDQIKDTGNMVKMSGEFKQKTMKYLDDMENFMPENSELLKQFKKQLSSSKATYIDKDVLGLLEINARASKSEANTLLKTVDNVNNTFKKFSTFTPGFHLRNMTGNASNMWLSGMSATDVASSYARATKLSKSDYMIDLISKNAAGTLTKAEAKDYNIIKQFIESGAKGGSKDIRDLGELIEKASKSKDSKNLIKKAYDGIFSASAKGNEVMDNLSRMALLSHAAENPKYVAKLGAKDPIDAMHKVLFNPQNMSPFEQKYIKKIIPFYTFTKQNLMFQMKNVVQNTTRYNKLVKSFNKMYDSVGEGNYRQYQKENFEIPIASVDGGTLGLKANLPAGDLGEYMSNPLQRLVSSTSPLIKTPFEKVSGKDMFTGQDISNQSDFDTLTKALGLNNAKKLIQGINEVANDEQANTIASLLPSVVRYSDTEKIQNQQQYEELMQYQNYVKQLKNQGIDIPTIRELTNSTNKSIKSINKRRNNRKRS